MWKEAIQDAVEKTRINVKKFGGRFPHVSENGIYHLNSNTEWTNGFWTGILWLCYEYLKEPLFQQAAIQSVGSFRQRLENTASLNHHDIGFLYSLSSKAQWMIVKDKAAKEMTLEAADILMKRWRPQSGILQAWGDEGDEVNGGRIIIDCLLNLPLLFWAHEMTGDTRYCKVAEAHAEKSRKFLVRGDDSSYHTFSFQQETGEALGGSTHQGYHNGSTWSRGQAWGIYGFALAYRYTRKPVFLETSKRMACYFIKNLPEDYVAYWDFDAPVDGGTKRDSSASAIAVCGILELLEHMGTNDPSRPGLEKGILKSMQSLVQRYSTIGEPDGQGFIKHGSYSVRSGNAPDDYMIWGDYFYLEALMRLAEGHRGYWYEWRM